MKLIDIINRTASPEPWSEGDNIPWNDPAFSARMLKEHLSQEHDAASRRAEKIERHVAWIHQHILAGRATRILDLGCGPGLYANRLASLGHTCTGIDFSPASIQYASEQAQNARLACAFACEDIRTAEYGAGYGLAMLIYGEFNVFKPEDVRRILDKVHSALLPGGILLLEPGTYAHTEGRGHNPSRWYSSLAGLFSARPHLVFEENIWDPVGRTTTTRHFVVDAASGDVSRFAATYQAYRDDELTDLLNQRGFGDVVFYPSLAGEQDASPSDFIALTARKSTGA